MKTISSSKHKAVGSSTTFEQCTSELVYTTPTLKDRQAIAAFLDEYFEASELDVIYGHIGHTVRSTGRSKGYATLMLKYALDVCRKLGLKSATLGCYKHNAPSVAVIKNCGGVLIAENDNYTSDITSQYYTIFLQG